MIGLPIVAGVVIAAYYILRDIGRALGVCDRGPTPEDQQR